LRQCQKYSQQLNNIPRRSAKFHLLAAEKCLRDEGNLNLARAVKTLCVCVTNNSDPFSHLSVSEEDEYEHRTYKNEENEDND
jgi:hypothetical protein